MNPDGDNLLAAKNNGTGFSSENSEFTHLHTHSYYSFFDSTLSPEQLVALAWKQGHKAVALTDTNCMTGAVVFYKLAEEAKLKPILGAEITQPLPNERKLLADRAAVEAQLRSAIGSAKATRAIDEEAKDESDQRDIKDTRDLRDVNKIARKTGRHNSEFRIVNSELSSGEDRSLSPSLCHGDRSRRAVLLARSFNGYSEICAVVTRRMLEPTFDLFIELSRLSEQVIVLSDSPEVLECIGGKGPDINSSRVNSAFRIPHCALGYALLTASRRCRRRNRQVYETARRLGIPLVAGCDVKLGSPCDAALHNLLQAMRRLTTIYQLSETDKIDPAQHFQSTEQVARFFGLDGGSVAPQHDAIFADLREAVANTARIADACNCKLPLKEWKFPKLPGLAEDRPRELRELVLAGMKKRYGNPLPPIARERMDSELEVIEKLGFTEYFLLVNRIVGEAHRRGFFTVGRGSGANSILSYALGFTEVCPIKFKLYFERFLNPDRSAPPDIDIDFSWKERDELIEWCFDHFGRDRVALICTIQTLQARQSIREVGKALGLSENEVNAFNRLQETRFHVEETVNSKLEIQNSKGGGAERERKVYNLAEQEPWCTVLRYAERIAGFPRHLSIHCGGILITPEPVTKFLPLTRSAKGFVITQMDMFSVEDLGLIKIDLLSNRSLGVLKDALRMTERNLQSSSASALPGGAPQLPESAVPVLLPENPGKVEIFQREAMRMKLAGTRRGTSVALAGVLGSFATCVQNTVANELVQQGAPLTVREQALSFQWVTNDPATRQLIDQGLTMGCFYIESPGMRALFERLRCKNFEEVVTASSIIRPGVAESGMMQEYIVRHQETSRDGELRIADYQVVEDETTTQAEGRSCRNSKFKIQNSKWVAQGSANEDFRSQNSELAVPATPVLANDIRFALPQIEPLSVTLQMATLQRETERAGMIGSRSGARVAVALDVKAACNSASVAVDVNPLGIGNAAFADQRAPVTLLPASSASERLASGAMPINAHAKSRALEEYFARSTREEFLIERQKVTANGDYENEHLSNHELRITNCESPASKSRIAELGVEAIRGYTVQPQGRGRSLNPHGPNKKLRIHHVMMDLLPETYGVMVYQEDVLRVAHDLAGMSYAEADLLRRAISGKMRSRDALLAIQDHFIDGVIAKGLPREDAEEIWRQMASFAGYSFCKGHSAAFAVLSYQVAFMKAHYPAEFFAGVLTNEGGFYGAHAYMHEARRWGIEIQPPCVNASVLDYTGLTLDASAARAAAGLNGGTITAVVQQPIPLLSEAPGNSDHSEEESHPATQTNRSLPFQLPRGTGRTGWIRVGLMAVQGVRQETKEAIVRAREDRVFASLEDLMCRTAVGLEECRTLIMAGTLDALADDEAGAEMWKPQDPRRVLHKRRGLLLKVECLFRARDAGLSDGFVKLTFPIWMHNRTSCRSGDGSVRLDFGIPNSEFKSPSRIQALQELCKLEADALNFTLSAHPLDLVEIPSDVIPAREIRAYNNKRIYMAGWMLAAKLLATKTTGQAMKMLTLEDNSGTFEAVLFPRIYAKFAPRTLGRGPYLVCGKVDMTLGSPTLNVEKIDVLPNRK